ncbi:hypothetical protein OE88DRAFT_1650605 [Heliocybe sulcata]|uniref:Uncharacterized protein n=1 Tax=Heliocybe sulcata TaxID=5364 RepID=A0A5C3NI59_9AGAM|nr:hypothetical protein OE88DRAFT_1650605 [Heliocybe sulcata]
MTGDVEVNGYVVSDEGVFTDARRRNGLHVGREPVFLGPLPSLLSPMPASVASLDSISPASDDAYDSDEEYRLAVEQEFQESLQQLQLILSVILLPYLGKWLGRRWSHWAYARYLRLGLGKAFLFGEKHLSTVYA